MQNLASLVLDDEKAIQYSECHRRHREEIESSDYLAVIGEKGEPLLPGIPAPNHTTQISGHGSFRQGKAQLLQFRVNLGSAPVGIVLGQASDQIPDFLRDPGSAAARTGSPPPVETKASTMPADDGLGFDNQEDIGPARPEAAESHPKQPVASLQWRPRSMAFEHGDLLAQSEDLQGCVASRTEKNAESTQHREEQLDHELTVARGANSMPRCGQTVDFTMR